MSTASRTRSATRSAGNKVSAAPNSSKNGPLTHMPIDETIVAPPPPSPAARLTCVSILVGVLAVWGQLSFVGQSTVPCDKVHGYMVPLTMTTFYLVSLPTLRFLTNKYLAKTVDVKLLLRECMILYNAVQVLLNGWMVYKIVAALVTGEHPFVGGDRSFLANGANYAVWVHYCDKYLEFLDTYFMILRGKMDQVSFLHVYHHTSIAWAWWAGLQLYPGGDIYFGALLNSLIHVMMYSYYTLSLLQVTCPWKRFLTQAQLLQFVSVISFSAYVFYSMPAGATWQQYTAIGIQVWEMLSLFVLFMHFYSKSYRQRRDAKSVPAKSVLTTTSKENHKGSADNTVAEHVSISSESSEEDRDEQSQPPPPSYASLTSASF